jgi:hypothetical protein
MQFLIVQSQDWINYILVCLKTISKGSSVRLCGWGLRVCRFNTYEKYMFRYIDTALVTQITNWKSWKFSCTSKLMLNHLCTRDTNVCLAGLWTCEYCDCIHSNTRHLRYGCWFSARAYLNKTNLFIDYMSTRRPVEINSPIDITQPDMPHWKPACWRISVVTEL